MPGMGQKYGKDYKTVCLIVSIEEHKRFRQWAVDYEVAIGEVARLGLNDERLWKRLSKTKRAMRAAKSGRE